MAKAPLRVSSALTLETRAGALAGKRWMELLESIHVTRSISAAAQAIGLSYKAAWDAVEAMNNLSEQPLVERTKGGKGGGGTRLTARGEQLVATFRAVEVENDRFLEAINARIGNRSGGDPMNLRQDLQVIARLNMLTSARNHFSGKVVRIRNGAVNDEVELVLAGGERIVSVITHESRENLGLKLGSEAIALIKASWIIVAIDDGAGLKLSARNQLAGTIRRLTPGAVNTEVVIELKGGNSVAAVVTKVSAKALRLVEGKPASAVFKASSVILGVTV
jgi:molybdate transport system regulatory protein